MGVYLLDGNTVRQYQATGKHRLSRTLAATATVLLVALAAVSTLTEGGAFAGWARVLGVTTAGIAAVRGAPFPVVVIAAAVVTAALRLCGVD